MKKPILELKEPDFYKRSTALRMPSNVVVDFGSKLSSVIRNLLDTLNSQPIAVGLAAIQIGVPERVIVVDAGKVYDAKGGRQNLGILVLINPELVSESKITEVQMEACMSLPEFQGEVERATEITVQYQTRTGKTVQMLAKGFLARVILHELDHLNGILYIDRMAQNKRLLPFELSSPR